MIKLAVTTTPTLLFGTPACCWCEVRSCGEGGPHSCPWGGGETPGPTSSGCWVGAGGNRKRPCVLHCSLLLDVQHMFVILAQDKIWEAYNRGDPT